MSDPHSSSHGLIRDPLSVEQARANYLKAFVECQEAAGSNGYSHIRHEAARQRLDFAWDDLISAVRAAPGPEWRDVIAVYHEMGTVLSILQRPRVLSRDGQAQIVMLEKWRAMLQRLPPLIPAVPPGADTKGTAT